METRIRLSLNKDWSFHRGDLPAPQYVQHGDIYGAAKAGAKQGPPNSMFDARDWEVVDIPHDYMIKGNTDPDGAADWGYKPKSNAWYRKCFAVDEKYRGKRFIIEFEGAAAEATVYFNGSVAKRNFSGYTGFTADVTDRIIFGGKPNVLAVYINGTEFEGWWYEGAGLYRPVWLNIVPEIRFAEEPYVSCEKLDGSKWRVTVSGSITGKGTNGKAVSVKKIIRDRENNIAAEFEEASAVIEAPVLWDLDNPYLYTVTSELYIDGVMSDSFTSSAGFRTIAVDAEKGFFLNSKAVKLYGTCNHQDFAGVGTAVSDSIWRYKVARLKSMGCNAYRSAHGMAPNGLVRACDEMGMLLMDENRNFETSEDCLEQLRTMVKRDRNHPSVVFYSIFNEEPLQGTEQGRNMALHMLDEIRRLDPSRFVTGAMNGGILEDCGAGNALDVVGVNYQLWSYDDIHRKYPSMPVVASEATSAFQTRGCTVTDYGKHTFSCYDEDAADWGNTVRETWREVNSRSFIMGAFMWTGFDYLGEPSPHIYPSVSSFFGLMDTCGFEKGGYYMSKAVFSAEPYAAAVPDHWNFADGETVKVMSCTNCEEAELFLNGKSCGRYTINKYEQHIWEVPFEAGELKLVGYNGSAAAAEYIKKTALQPARIVLAPCFEAFDERTEEIPVMAYLVDENGTPVPNASGKMKFSVSGGKILGTGNGDPNCHEAFDGKTRSLFAGKAMVIVSADGQAENVLVKAKTEGLKQARVTVPVKSRPAEEVLPSVKEIYLSGWRISPVTDSCPDPNAVIADSDMNSWQPFTPENGAAAELYGKEGKFVMFRTNVDIPEEINCKAPALHFRSIWGKCRVYVNGGLAGEFLNEWASPADVAVKPGKSEITVLVQSVHKDGAGICSSVILM
ncbi:MAG: DUF4982 domain-containing protein [Prevotella sp.]|nr:DUF4982 domain-containing protein [Prevotella sp.]